MARAWTEADWLFNRNDSDGLVWFLNTNHKATRTKIGKRKLRLFCCAALRQIWDLIANDETRAAVEVCERFADGAATADELKTAQRASFDADHKIRAAFGTDAGNAVLQATSKAQTEKELKRFIMYACLARFHALRPEHRGGVSPESPEYSGASRLQCDALRDIFGNPFRPVTFSPSWRTSTAVTLAKQMYDSREFSAMPILADALQDAGCDNEDVLTHCRDAKQLHVRGCWVVDHVLGKG